MTGIKLTLDEVIEKRLRDSMSEKVVKENAYKLRRFVCGDEVAIGGEKMSLKYDKYNEARRTHPLFPDFHISQFEQGVSNHTLSWIKVLVMQTLIQHPEISWPDLDPTVSQVREAWAIDRLDKTGFIAQEETLIYSFLIDGIAVGKIGLKNDLPAIKATDITNLHWDIHSRFPDEWRFIGQTLRLTISEAREDLGEDVVAMILNTEDKQLSDEDIIHVIEYWDKDTLAYVRVKDMRVLKRMDNPFGFIPYEVFHGPILPSLSHPLPHILGVIGSQTAHTEIQRSMTEQFKKLRPIMEIHQGSYTEESFAQFLNDPDDVNILVKTEPGDGGITMTNFNQLSGEVLAMKSALEQEIVRHLGVNPYASGATPGVSFSSETLAIQGASGLNAQNISERLADFIAKSIRKMVQTGFLYDDQPFTVRVGGETANFHSGFTIEPILRDDAPVIVQPGNIETDAMKLLNSQQLQQQMNTDPFTANNHTLKKEVWSRILANAGYRDIDTLLSENPDQAKLDMIQGIAPEQLQQILQIGIQAMQQQAQQPEAGPGQQI